MGNEKESVGQEELQGGYFRGLQKNKAERETCSDFGYRRKDSQRKGD